MFKGIRSNFLSEIIEQLNLIEKQYPDHIIKLESFSSSTCGALTEYAAIIRLEERV